MSQKEQLIMIHNKYNEVSFICPGILLAACGVQYSIDFTTRYKVCDVILFLPLEPFESVLIDGRNAQS